MTWFRRGRDTTPPAAPEPPPSGDDPATLRATVFALNRYINLNSGQMPGESVVTARRITDTLREVIDTSELRPLDIYAVVSLKGMLNDYLPTTLKSFLALDDAHLNVVRPSGRTPVASLQEQLEALLDAAGSVLLAARAQDADALLTQGTFLRTKFSRSDLDL
jgi:hypothetical protein